MNPRLNTLTGDIRPDHSVILTFDGQELVISTGPSVRAEHRGAWGRLARVWPKGRMLEPTTDGGFRIAPGWDLPAGRTWGEIFAEVPSELIHLVARFPSRQWPLLEFANSHLAFLDLLRSNPALAYALACIDELRRANAVTVAATAAKLPAQKQRMIAGRLGFPATDASVNLVRRIIPEAVNPSALRMLRSALPLPGKLAKTVSHIDKINAGVLAFLTNPTVRGLATPGLLREISAHDEETAKAPTADALLDTLQMGTGIRRWKGMPALRSRMHVREIHDRVLLEFQAEQERLRREREEYKARERERVRVEQERWAQQMRIAHERLRLQATEDRALLVRNPRPTISRPPGAFPDLPIPGTDKIVPILSVADLQVEGLDQHNCVAARAQEVRWGRQYIYRVLSPQRATLAITKGDNGRWLLKELKLKANASASKKTHAAVHEWLDRHQPKLREWDDTPF